MKNYYLMSLYYKISQLAIFKAQIERPQNGSDFFFCLHSTVVPSDTTFILPENQSRIKGVVVSEKGGKNSRKNVKWAEFDV